MARQRASSRLAPPPTPVRSVVIHLAVLVLWVALFLLAFGRGGVIAWSVGLAYLAYDLALLIFTGWQISRITTRDAAAAPAAGGLTLGVLVAAHNEATALPVTLTALLNADRAPDQIVIADDGSSDSTARILTEQFGLRDGGVPTRIGQTVVLWLRLPHAGKASALNAALTACTCDVILTVDADTVVEPGAIKAVRQAFSAEPDLVGVTGVITPVCAPGARGQVLQWFQTYEYIRNFLGRYAWMRIDCLQLISGAFAGFRRSAVVEVGGFDNACLVEDYELVARLQRYAGEHHLSWRFRALGDAQARTEAPGTLLAFLRQRRRWFGGFLQTQWWYRAMVGDRRLGALGTVMLPIKALDTVHPLYGLTALALLASFLISGRFDILGPVLLVVAGKLVIDMAFAAWSVRRYRHWTGDPGRASMAGSALATLVAPFTFTLLLHAGAALGWVAFLGGTARWGSQRRFGMTSPAGG
ncbi:glycosyl transferase family 2 [Mycolicibacterium confluentis]|uniref:Glycosyl transferase family 2 n=1 Tax=Mycolicibacterium confluentis TaxID=28047 RepID=A0A7I7XYB5_9MYCO|nr:glycosyl transferase family 2 [Mycolicibacterium confluentis]